MKKTQQYVTTARAKGLPEWRLIMKYPVRVAINPLISTIGWTLPFIVSGEIIVSQTLGLETLGPVLLAGGFGRGYVFGRKHCDDFEQPDGCRDTAFRYLVGMVGSAYTL